MAGECKQLTPPPAAGHNTKEVSQLARRKSEDSYTLPDLQARGLAALCEEFFAMPGVEEEYQAWLEAKKGKKSGVRAMWGIHEISELNTNRLLREKLNQGKRIKYLL